jgi:hypothetical protein
MSNDSRGVSFKVSPNEESHIRAHLKMSGAPSRRLELSSSQKMEVVRCRRLWKRPDSGSFVNNGAGPGVRLLR